VEHAGDLAEYLLQAAQAVSIPISRQQSDQLIQFARALQGWNKTINLTSIDSSQEVVVKHFIDSLAPLQFGLLTGEQSILDVGSGAGLPSIPLKILQSGLRPVLLEPNIKKVSFLLSVVGTLELRNVRVVNQTLEQFSATTADHFDYVLVRALSQDTWGGKVAGLLSSNGVVLAYRSARIEPGDVPPETQLLREWSYELPFGYGRRVLAAFSKDHGDVPRGTVGAA
jgi:16S rRNA (guanine527-N7)-methyltransferase